MKSPSLVQERAPSSKDDREALAIADFDLNAASTSKRMKFRGETCMLKPPTLQKRWDAKGTKGSIYHGDALAFLQTLPDESADVIFLDPPFNLKKRYGAAASDNLPADRYAQWVQSVVLTSARKVRSGGALYFYHLPQWAFRIAALLDGTGGMLFRHWIAISMKSTFVRGDRLYPAHYALLYLTKGEPRSFVRPKLEPALCRHCGELVKDYGGYRAIIERNGINLSDVWDDLSPVRHRNSKNRVSNELPRRLFERVLSISGGKGLVYVDPFVGSGTGIVTAADFGMKFLACDVVKQTITLVTKRMTQRAKGPKR